MKTNTNTNNGTSTSTTTAQPKSCHTKKPVARRSTSATPAPSDLLKLDSRFHLLVIRDGRYDLAATSAVWALAQTGRYYLMAGELVELMVCDDYWTAYMRTVPTAELALALSSILICVEVDVSALTAQQTVSSETLAKYIEEFRPFDQLPVLAGVVNGPAFRKDGSVINKAGYDKASGLFLLDPKARPEEFEGWTTGDKDLDELLVSLG